MEYSEIILSSRLFKGVSEDELSSMLACLGAKRKKYCKGERIYSSGDVISAIGLVLCGRIHIESADHWGSVSLIAECAPSDIFGEVCGVMGEMPIDFDVSAAADCDILFLSAGKILCSCSSACPFHMRVTENLAAALGEKTLALAAKVLHLSKRTIREKLLSYLSEQSKKSGSSEFDIPFNRQQLADYLCSERSALSAELGRLKNDGIIDFKKNHFVLL
ncbi:MAG: Crp/Fnr family transcriptional regulator [Oscillospiraceae bacterium]|nr:Crp/Fnr family transcriptional regulator [Oscillospiraceae bacterium]